MQVTRLRGARTHNLAGVDLDLRPGEVVVLAGPSGSGKSSLALDTLYAEGQRRFVESFSPYARQFLERLERPPMDSLEPVPAGIAVDRRAPVKSSRSTVATMADLEPWLVALYAREAIATCPEHGAPAVELDPVGAAERVERTHAGEALAITYPLPIADADAYLAVRDALTRDGYRRLWLGGAARDLDTVKPSQAVKAREIEVVVDRVAVTPEERSRIAQSLEQAFDRGQGVARLHGRAAGRPVVTLRRGAGCPACARPLPAAEPGLFSYDSPVGACATCRGFGRVIGVDLARVIPDPRRTLAGGAIRPWNGKSTKWERAELVKLCARHGIPMDRPWGELGAAAQRLVLEGDGPWQKDLFPGVLGWFEWLGTRTYKMHVRVLLSRYRAYDPCPACGGGRLGERARSFRVGGLDIVAFRALEIRDARARLAALTARTSQGALAAGELSTRLEYLERVGLGYLALDRQARTLSGGEAQRVTLTAALGTSLHGALFVLDEPTVGLHPSDVAALSSLVRELADRGNTVVVVEHDPELLRAADRVIELGPGAGAAGGRVVADGTPAEVVALGGATARALAPLRFPARGPRARRGTLRLRGARENNLRDLHVDIPLGVLVGIAGPSGSGKSTLVEDVLHRELARRLGDFEVPVAGAHDSLEVDGVVGAVTLVDQAPLGRTSRGNAATYTKAWDTVRRLLAATPRAMALGLGPGAFSFNVAGGRCEACSGEGFETVEMQFLADVRLVCPVCRGKRFGPEVLTVKLDGRDAAELLELTVDEALSALRAEPAVARALGPVALLGLGYLRLGQPLSTLSGGEAQRLKLARALAEGNHAGSLLLLDEPSAGLHVSEVDQVLEALDVIVRAGGSVIVVDHDLRVLAAADHLIELGPGAGADGGRLVATGTPSELAAGSTRTGAALAAALRVTGAAPASAAPRGELSRELRVTRAREHNLREVSVGIPHGALTVMTGPSGSGKSTLAFDVVFAEGQRRFLETLTPYARQFLPTLPRADVDSVTGVPPSIALEQRTARAGARSTVATVTEIAHYLRLLFAKLGVPHCPEHDEPIAARSEEQVVADVRRVRGRYQLLAPVVESRKGTYLDVFTAAARGGILQAWCDGRLVSTDDPPRLRKTIEHSIDLVYERPAAPSTLRPARVVEALRAGGGAVKLRAADGTERRFSTRSACPICGFSVPELDPRWFSFATAQGRCPTCEGEGTVEAPVPRRRGKAPKAEAPRVRCPECEGARLAPVPRAVRLAGHRYAEVVSRSVAAALELAAGLAFEGDAALVGRAPLEELVRRLEFLVEVGLDYLGLDRAASGLSGGEMQRLRLAAQLGSGLTGALYVLDEPTIGLHPRDTGRLIGNLRRLVDLGSTVLVVEHDEAVIRAADHLVDLGPGGGARGGNVMAEGPSRIVLADPASPTGRALTVRAEPRAPLPVPAGHPRLVLEGASEHNLRGVDLSIPVGRFVVVAGVSGSGKSTLVRRVLLPALRARLGLVTEPAGAHRSLRGEGALARALSVDQSPIGRTPRSVPATFLGIWDELRTLYASSPDAKVRGFNRGRFSFNTGAGRCPTCEGQGVVTHEMSFLPDAVTRCPACEGLRFEPQTLAVRHLGRSIGDVLRLTAEEAVEVLANHPRVTAPLRTLVELGAGYVQLGQGSHTLSGGEAQRLKLAAELTATARHEPTLYVLDEPTTGLHVADVARLVRVLSRLVDRGDTLVVIEHHPEVLASADHLVELGPEGGVRGGTIVAEGPPRAVARRRTPTGRVLAELFGAEPVTARAAARPRGAD